MSNTRILDIDSTYRNRNEWPLPGAFEIPISQTGRKDKNTVDYFPHYCIQGKTMFIIENKYNHLVKLFQTT